MNYPIEKRYFDDTNAKQFGIQFDEYKVRDWIRGDELHRDLTCGTQCAIVLTHLSLDSAIVGFENDGEQIDCTQIQGGTRRLKQLVPIKWDRVLLGSLVRHSKQSNDLRRVLLIPSYLIEDNTLGSRKVERFQRIYDQNALAHGFSHSREEQRYILDL